MDKALNEDKLDASDRMSPPMKLPMEIHKKN